MQENIEEEKLCQKECVASDQCQFYTWFDKTNTVFRNYCLLFTSCDKVKFSKFSNQGIGGLDKDKQCYEEFHIELSEVLHRIKTTLA